MTSAVDAGGTAASLRALTSPHPCADGLRDRDPLQGSLTAGPSSAVHVRHGGTCRGRHVARYPPAPGKRKDLLAAMKRMAARAADVKGCFGAQACESDHDREDLVAVSRWESA